MTVEIPEYFNELTSVLAKIAIEDGEVMEALVALHSSAKKLIQENQELTDVLVNVDVYLSEFGLDIESIIRQR